MFLAILNGVKLNLKAVFICISLIAKDVQHFFQLYIVHLHVCVCERERESDRERKREREEGRAREREKFLVSSLTHLSIG